MTSNNHDDHDDNHDEGYGDNEDLQRPNDCEEHKSAAAAAAYDEEEEKMRNIRMI